VRQTDWEERQEFERVAALESTRRDAEAEAQAGNPNFQARHAPDWVQEHEETAWAWGASEDWRRDAKKARTQMQRDKLIRDAKRAFWQ
jgi:hypothetical protein